MLPLSLPAIWDEEHVKALLGLRRHPTRLVYAEPWRTWMEERGGEKQVIERLQSIPLASSQKQLLDLLLAHPEASTIFYANKLHVAHSKYFVHLKGLLQILSTELNEWKVEPPQDSHAAPLLSNLPAPLTSLVGAEESVATVVNILERPDVRLLTLTGLGGIGKTRLALTVGARLQNKFRNGVFFIPLEALNDPAFLGAQIAHFLNIETDGMQSLVETLKTYLRGRQILLILDNFEQLIPGGTLVAELLETAAGMKVLITSREVLNLYGEHRFDVPELPHPDPNHLPSLEQLSAWPAIDLFIQRVQAHYPAFALTDANQEAVVNICNRLDGLPLAIELAAAQVKLLPSAQVLPRLERGLKSLRDASLDRPPHQKTLWDAFDWSYDLLPAPEQALFRRLAVFGREWSMDAAQTVCETEDVEELLEKLADKSLVRFTSVGVDGGLRCQMLQAVREYALDRLSGDGETEETQRRHAKYYLEMVLEAEPHIGTSDQIYWMRRIEEERENLQTALQWMLNQKETEMAFTLLGAAWRYYNMLNIWDETETWMDRALAQSTQPQSTARMKTLWGAYWLAARQNNHPKSAALAKEGLRLARKLEDRRLIGLLLQCMSDVLCHQHQYDKALQAIEESLSIFRELGDQEEIAWALGHRSSLFSLRGDLAKGREILQESLSIFRAIGNNWAVEQVLRDLAVLLLQQGDFERVKTVLEESLSLSEKLGKRMGIGGALNLQGQLALRQSDLGKARKYFEEAQSIYEKLGDQHSLSYNRAFLEQLEKAE
jgi:predicted ATPase